MIIRKTSTKLSIHNKNGIKFNLERKTETKVSVQIVKLVLLILKAMALYVAGRMQ